MPKSLLLLLYLMMLYPRSRPRPDFTYTKNLRTQNLHGMDLQDQSAICLRTLLWPTCRIFFAEPEPWAYKQLTHFSVFEIFENLQLPALLLSLPPRVALFSERAPWAHKQSSRFTVFVISENSSSSVVLLPLAPVSLIVQLFDAFLAFSLLFGAFRRVLQPASKGTCRSKPQFI